MRTSRAFLGIVGLIAASLGAARAQSPGFENVLAAASLDFDNDGAMDRAVLVRGDESADLYLYLGDADPSAPPGKMKLALVKKDFIFSGLMWGTLPTLSVTDKGSLVVRAENSAIGRNKWSMALTVALRSGEFLVLGLTYNTYDALDPKAGGNCDLNLATGKGTRNGKLVTFAARPIKVAEWSEDSLPRECRF